MTKTLDIMLILVGYLSSCGLSYWVGWQEGYRERGKRHRRTYDRLCAEFEATRKEPVE